jgi:hypothetical protein
VERSVIENELVACFENVALAELVSFKVRQVTERNIAVKAFVIIIAMLELLLVSCGIIVSNQGCIIAARDIADFAVVCFDSHQTGRSHDTLVMAGTYQNAGAKWRKS